MAINTDAVFDKDVLAHSGAPHPTDYKDTQKLLSVSTEPTEGNNLKHSDSITLIIKGSVRSLNADQNGHRSPMRSGSAGNIAPSSPSPSRLSFSRVSSPKPSGPEPRSYLWLAVLSCFCPAVPINIFALYFSHMSRSILATGDYEGAKRLGRLALLLSIIAILVGLAIIFYLGISEGGHR